MQTLFLIKNGTINLQSGDNLYIDSVENFIKDGGVITDGITEIDYVPDTKQCAINGEFFQPFPNQCAEENINNIATIIANKQEREKPTPIVYTLDELKEQKHNELKNIMEKKRSVLTVDYDEDKFDANEKAQLNMNTLLKTFDFGATSVSIRSANENTHTFNQTHCNELALLMVSAVNKLYSEYWALKDKLYNCTTKEEVDAIVWE